MCLSYCWNTKPTDKTVKIPPHSVRSVVQQFCLLQWKSYRFKYGTEKWHKCFVVLLLVLLRWCYQSCISSKSAKAWDGYCWVLEIVVLILLNLNFLITGELHISSNIKGDSKFQIKHWILYDKTSTDIFNFLPVTTISIWRVGIHCVDIYKTKWLKHTFANCVLYIKLLSL